MEIPIMGKPRRPRKSAEKAQSQSADTSKKAREDHDTEIEFRTVITVNGKRLDARHYGFRAWPIRVAKKRLSS